MIEFLYLNMGFILTSVVTLVALFVLGIWVLVVLVFWAMLEEIFDGDRKIGRFIEDVFDNPTD